MQSIVFYNSTIKTTRQHSLLLLIFLYKNVIMNCRLNTISVAMECLWHAKLVNTSYIIYLVAFCDLRLMLDYVRVINFHIIIIILQP